MKVCKEAFCVCVGLLGFFDRAGAIQPSQGSPVTIHINPVPEYVCAGSEVSFGATISNVEGPAEVRISALGSTVFSAGMGGASAKLSVPACEHGVFVVYFSFGDFGSYSSNFVVISLAGIETVPGGPVCAPTIEPIRYRAYPTDAAGYGLCWPQWTGPNVVVDANDPWRAFAHCHQGGYYYAYAALGADPPCRIEIRSDLVMACEVHLKPAYEQDYPSPYLFPNVCINAQPSFARAKYRVEVLPDDTRAVLSLAEDSVEVVLSRRSVGNRDTFYVGAGDTPGRYGVVLAHEKLLSCAETNEGTVFEFDLTVRPAPSPGASTSRGAGNYDAVSGTVWASTPDASQAGYGALLTRGYEVVMETEPGGAYGGRVKAGIQAVHEMDARATLYKNAAADDWTLGVSAALGFLRVSIAGRGAHSIATATFNARLRIADSPSVDAGNFTYSTADFRVPLLWVTRQFGERVIQRVEDISRIFTVGEGVPVEASIGVLCVRRDGNGVADVKAATAQANLEVDVQEDGYEIVP